MAPCPTRTDSPVPTASGSKPTSTSSAPSSNASRPSSASARKNSATSSKPPSSDLVKPPKPTAATGDGGTDGKPRRLGGQPGHQQHLRAPFPAAQVTAFAEHTLAACPHCGGPLRRNGGCARVVQQVDVERPPLRVERHTCPE